MKITKTRLKEIIKEEVTKVLEEKSCKRDTDIEGVKVVEEEEELDETSAMGAAPTGAVAGYSGTTTEEEKKKKLSHS